jgi:3-oxoacyl-[acyl-carrier protein] reductase
MGQEFKGKKILITGASKGLGKAAAIAFEKEGANLALAARSEDKLNLLTNSFLKKDKHLIFNLDLLETKNIKTLTDTVLKKWKSIDVILHCVGGSLGVNETLVEWDNLIKCLNGNIGIASEINRQLVPRMKEQNSGSIIHVGSIVSSEAVASVPYSTAKAALSGYVKPLGIKLAEHGIIVSGILPGAFYGDDNAMFRYEYYKPEEYKEFVKSLPQGRMPHAEEYVPMLFMLSNPKSKIMSGSLISMDGAQGRAYYNYAI